MLDLDLRTSRLNKEQQKRRDDAKKRRERELQLQKEQTLREEELAVRLAQRKEEEEKALILKQIAENEELRITGGIRFNHYLKPYTIDGEDDKIILPEDCLTELTQQDAFTRGAMTFKLSLKGSSTEQSTHCGVREFSAPAGCIGLPPKVIASLSDTEVNDSMVVEIKYVVLAKCTFAKLQPKQNDFIEVGPVKQCLEENLRFHTALSVGDQLTVWYRGKAHVLCVVEMRPEGQGSLVDTDVEVDLALSEEYLQHQQRQQETADAAAGTARFLGGATASSGAPSPATEAVGASSVAFQSIGRTLSAVGPAPSIIPTAAVSIPSLGDHISHSDQLVRILQVLHTEAPAADKDTVTLKIRMPGSGGTKVRRFAHTEVVAQAFLYIVTEISKAQLTGAGIGAQEGVSAVALLAQLQLSTRFPARTLRMCDVLPAVQYESLLQHISTVGGGTAVPVCLTGTTFSDLHMNVPSEAVIASLL